MLNDSMTNTGTTSSSTVLVNRNNKVNRSLTAAVKSGAKQVDDNSKIGRMNSHNSNNSSGGTGDAEPTVRQLMMEDSSSSHSTAPLDSFDVMDKVPLAPVKAVHRSQRQQQPLDSNHQQQQQLWGKHIEEGIHGIMKRLDQLTIARENNLSGQLG